MSSLGFQNYEWVAISCLTMVYQVVRNKQKQNKAVIQRTCGIKFVDHCHFIFIIAHIYITAKHIFFFSLAIPVHCLVSLRTQILRENYPSHLCLKCKGRHCRAVVFSPGLVSDGSDKRDIPNVQSPGPGLKTTVVEKDSHPPNHLSFMVHTKADIYGTHTIWLGDVKMVSQ